MTLPGASFSFDPAKETSNIRKHGVSFTEAASTLADPSAASWFDEEHSSGIDQRFIHLGYSVRGRLLFVVHNEFEGQVRIISAGLATFAERKLYEEG